MSESYNTSLQKVASEYARLLNVRVTSSSIKKDIEENPYYPSLLSLSDTFDHYHISNSAFEIAPVNLEQFEPPFIAFTSVPDVGKDFVLVKNMTIKEVTYQYKNKKARTVPKEEFLKQYQHVVWTAKPDERSGEAGFEKKRKEEAIKKNKKMFWRTGIAVLLLLAVTANLNTANIFSYSAILFIKLLGVATTVLLLVYETDKSNAFVSNICSAGEHINCDAVLSSKAAKIKGITWADIGFFYFAATTLWILLPFVTFFEKIALIAMANALVAPYILFSLYYQWKVVKQWCPLCLTVQGTLFLELIWSFSAFWTAKISFSLGYSHIATFAFCILLPVISWYSIKQILAQAKDAGLYSSAYRRIQYNPEIFNSLLLQQAKVTDGWQLNGIDVGNPNADHTIIKICNPYCNPCAKAHAELEEILKYSNNTRLKIIFMVKNGDNDRGAIVARHLLAVASEGDAAKTQQCLDHWYLTESKNYEMFSQLYPMNGELKQQEPKIDAMIKWCKDAEIMFTPTIFVDGHRLPENYNLQQLKHIL
jgi:uncharacterized membrane protein